MVGKVIRRCAIALAAWLPFFALWVLFTTSSARGPVSAIFISSLITVGTAGFLGIAVWQLCRRWPWPLNFNLNFYLLHVVFALLYAAAWIIGVDGLDALRRGSPAPSFWSLPVLARQLMTGIWFYTIFAGISYATQTSSRLHDKKQLSVRAQPTASSAPL